MGVGVAAALAFWCSSAIDCMYVLRCDVSCCVGVGVGVEVDVVVADDVVVELMCWSAIFAYKGRLGRVARRL